IHVALIDFQKPFRRLLAPGDILGQIRSDAISVQHRSFLVLKRNEHSDCQTFYNPPLAPSNEGQPVKSGLRWCANIGAIERQNRLGGGGLSVPDPAIAERRWITVDIERIFDTLTRKRELDEYFSAF